MSNYGRTSKNRERLQQKSFSKNPIIPSVIVNTTEVEEWDYYKWPKSAGGSYKPSTKTWKAMYSYSVVPVEPVYSFRYGKYYPQHTMKFNKPQLIGKVFQELDGKYYRIIS